MKIFVWTCLVCLVASAAFADLSTDEVNRLKESATIGNPCAMSHIDGCRLAR
jgi:hypothetical protein